MASIRSSVVTLFLPRGDIELRFIMPQCRKIRGDAHMYNSQHRGRGPEFGKAGSGAGMNPAAVRERILHWASFKMDGADAEELAQETMALLAGKYAHLESACDVVPVAIATMKNKAREMWRRRKRHDQIEADPQAQALNPEEAAGRRNCSRRSWPRSKRWAAGAASCSG